MRYWRTKRHASALLLALVVSCYRHSPEAPPPLEEPNVVPDPVQCQAFLQEGLIQFGDWKTKGLQETSNFEIAVPSFRAATKFCRGSEVEGGAWYHLASASFLSGNWAEAATAYDNAGKFAQFRVSALPAKTAGMLRQCANDRALNDLRLARLAETHRDFEMSLQSYQRAANTSCSSIKAYATDEVNRVRAILRR